MEEEIRNRINENKKKGVGFTAQPPILEKDNLDDEKPLFTEEEKSFLSIIDNMFITYQKKNHDYGNSFEKSMDQFGQIASTVRLSDKMNRVIQLTREKAWVNEESVRDTLLDMANYAILTVMWLDKKKDGDKQD